MPPACWIHSTVRAMCRARAGTMARSRPPMAFARPGPASARTAGLECRPPQSGAVRTAHAGVHRRAGDVEIVQPGLQPVPDAHARCRGGDCPPRQRGAQAALSGAHGRRPLDRHHESHRAAGRIRSGRAAQPRRARGDHYRISGNKIFITWGEHDMTENIVRLVLARLPDAPPGVKGISLFLCPKFLVNDDGSWANATTWPAPRSSTSWASTAAPRPL